MKSLLLLTSLCALLVTGAGCSNQENIAGPALPQISSGEDINPVGPPVRVLIGRVADINSKERLMMFRGQQSKIQVTAAAKVIMRAKGTHLPITFNQIERGDSLEVRGNFQGSTLFVTSLVYKDGAGAVMNDPALF